MEFARDSFEVFCFSTLGVLAATNYALVELLKKAKIQVYISIIYNDYMASYDGIKCFKLIYSEKFFLKDVRDKFEYLCC